MSGSLLMSLATIESTTCIWERLISAADARLPRRLVTTNSLNATVSSLEVASDVDEVEAGEGADCAKAEAALSAANKRRRARANILVFNSSSMVVGSRSGNATRVMVLQFRRTRSRMSWAFRNGITSMRKEEPRRVHAAGLSRARVFA